MKNKTSLFFHLAFLLLIAFSICFAEMRATFYTGAEELLRILQEGTAPSGWSLKKGLLFLPLIAVKMDAALSVVTLLYALTYALWAYAVFLISYYLFRRRQAGTVLLITFFVSGQLFFLGNWDVYAVLCFLYLLYSALRWTCRQRPQGKNISLGILTLCLIGLLFLLQQELYDNPYKMILPQEMYFNSMFAYLWRTAIEDYLLLLFFMAYFFLRWMLRKEYVRSLAFVGMTLLMLFLFFRSSGLRFQMEERLMPLVFFFLILLEDELDLFFKERAFFRYVIFFFCFFAVFVPLKKQDVYRQRKEDLLYLLEKAAVVGEPKVMLDYRLQQLEKYISPEYIHLESILLSRFYPTSTQSVFFFLPDDVRPPDAQILFQGCPLATTKLSSLYFPDWTPSPYCLYSQAIIERKLSMHVFCGAEKRGQEDETIFFDENKGEKSIHNACNQQSQVVYEGQHAVYTSEKAPYAFTFELPDVRRGDSLEISVMRKGEGAHLIFTTRSNPSPYYLMEQSVGTPNAHGWQELKMNVVFPKETPNTILYVWNKRKDDTLVYFDNLSVKIWRE